MKKNLKACLCLLLLGVFITSCKKESSNNTIYPGKKVVESVNRWLDNQKQIAFTGEQKAAIQLLKSNLNFNLSRFESFNQNERLIIVPLKENYTKDLLSKEGITNLLLVIDNSGTIKKGDVVQYIPSYTQLKKNLPLNTFYKMYNSLTLDCDGEFIFLTIGGEREYKWGYTDGKLSYRGIIYINPTSVNTPPQDPIGPQPTCTDWYWLTTYYYQDGHTEDVQEYAFTTCESSGGGGGDHENTPEEQPLSQIKDWIVAKNPAKYWQVRSYESFTGKYDNTLPLGYKFTGASHVTSQIENAPGSGLIYTWQEFFGQTTLNNDVVAKSQIGGKVTTPPIVGSDQITIPPQTKLWGFNDVF